jgi:hypothetical protein
VLHVRVSCVLLVLLALAGCKRPDPQADLQLSGLETYWAIDSSAGTTRYLAPVVRFRIANKTGRPGHSIQATATFRRKGEEAKDWGSAWLQVTLASHPLGPGESTLVVLKSDGRYFSTGPPETFFTHALFKDALVEVFLREGSSEWKSFAKADIERRIGTREVTQSPAAP